MDIDDEFIRRRTTEVLLADGTRVRIRPIVPGDKGRLTEGLRRLSPESRYLRFLRSVDHLSDEQLTYLTEIDYVNHFAWGAELVGRPGHPGIGLARYVRLAEEPEVAEAAVAVLDDYQGRGLGAILLDLLAESATANGIRYFRSFVLRANEKVLRALDRPGVERTGEEGTTRIQIPLPLPPDAVRDSALYEALRAVARGEVQLRPLR